MVKQLRIGAHVYPVKLIDSNVSFGYTVEADIGKGPCIEINRAADNRQRMLTLLHEALHATFKEFGVRHHLTESGDESLARLLECAIAQLFIQNKAFARELIETLGAT